MSGSKRPYTRSTATVERITPTNVNAKKIMPPKKIDFPASPLAGLHSPSSFLGSPSLSSPSKSLNTKLPISCEQIREWRDKLLQHDRAFNKYILKSTDSSDNKELLQNFFLSYQTAFNSLVTAYAQVAEQLSNNEDCKTAVIKTCSGITTNCGIVIKEMVEKLIPQVVRTEVPQCLQDKVPTLVKDSLKIAAENTLPNMISKINDAAALRPTRRFSDIIKDSNKIQVPRGPTVAVTETSSFIVAPTPQSARKFRTFGETKDALIKTIDPSTVGLKVERLLKAEGNAVRIEARSVDLEKMKKRLADSKIGLEIKTTSKYNPRILIYDVPIEMKGEEIVEAFIKSNLNGEENADVKTIYIYPHNEGMHTTKVVIEIPSKVRSSLLLQSRIYLGYSSHKFIDHVMVKQCFKCLQFGHVSRLCKSEKPKCGNCAEEHEMRDCPDRGTKTKTCCYNCKAEGVTDMAHTALDGEKCPILRKKLRNKVNNTDYGTE